MNWFTVAGQLLGLGGSMASGWIEKKKIQAQADVDIKKAQVDSNIRLAENGQMADINWDAQSMKNAQNSWKDEYWTIVISIPMILCFVPSMAPYVKQGFDALSGTPAWYQGAVVTAIAAAFGMKKFANWKMRKEPK